MMFFSKKSNSGSMKIDYFHKKLKILNTKFWAKRKIWFPKNSPTCNITFRRESSKVIRQLRKRMTLRWTHTQTFQNEPNVLVILKCKIFVWEFQQQNWVYGLKSIMIINLFSENVFILNNAFLQACLKGVGLDFVPTVSGYAKCWFQAISQWVAF